MSAVAAPAAFTTRTLFDDLFRRFIPDGVQLLLDDEEEVDEEQAAATDTQGQQEHDAQRSTSSLTKEITAPVAAVAAANDDDQPLVELDLEDDAVLEATALGANEEEDHAYVQQTLQQKVLRKHDGMTQPALADGSTGDGVAVRIGGGGAVSKDTKALLLEAPVLTADEQLERMPIDGEEIFTGVCVLFNHGKGFGFISPDIGGPDVYFTRESISLSFSRRIDEWASVQLHQDLRAALEHSGQPAAIDASIKKKVDAIEDGLRLVQLGRAFLVGGERVAFRVTSNAAGGGASGGGAGQRRKLRAVDVVAATPSNGPIMLERVLLNLVGEGNVMMQLLGVTPAPQRTTSSSPALVATTDAADAEDATVASNDNTNESAAGSSALRRFSETTLPAITLFPTPASNTPTELVEPLTSVRYPGWIKSIAGGDKGYIRPDGRAMPSGVDTTSASASQDAVLFVDVIVWDASVDRQQRNLEEGVLVEYSIVGFDRNKKPLAAVVTGRGGVPLHPSSWDLTEVAKQKRAEMLASGKGGDIGGRGGSGSGSGVGAKRIREDVGELLLLEDDMDGGYV